MTVPSDKPTAQVRALPSGRDEVRCESRLDGVRADDLWLHATTEQGINAELRPILRMARPRGAGWGRVTEIPRGVPAGRCWIRLFGLLPVDYDDLMIEEVGPGYRFRECSATTTMTVWAHDRTIHEEDSGAVLHDRIIFEVAPRLQRLRGTHRFLVAQLFKYRHRRLRTIVGPRLRVDDFSATQTEGATT